MRLKYSSTFFKTSLRHTIIFILNIKIQRYNELRIELKKNETGEGARGERQNENIRWPCCIEKISIKAILKISNALRRDQLIENRLNCIRGRCLMISKKEKSLSADFCLISRQNGSLLMQRNEL